MGIAEDPAGAMGVEHDRQWANGSQRFDYADLDRTGGSTFDGDPLLVDVGLEDGAVLHPVDGLAAFLGGQLIEERRVRGGVAEFLRRRFQGDVARISGHENSCSLSALMGGKKWRQPISSIAATMKSATSSGWVSMTRCELSISTILRRPARW